MNALAGVWSKVRLPCLNKTDSGFADIVQRTGPLNLTSAEQTILVCRVELHSHELGHNVACLRSISTSRRHTLPRKPFQIKVFCGS
jgi:hypothetical protein